jgi:excinuclease ABC subunit C
MKNLPAAPGVYRFRDAGGRVLYVGRATHLRSRVASYWGDLRDRRHLRRMVPQVARVEAVACDSVHEAAWLERNLLERSKPRWNRIRGGMEAPFCIRMTPSKIELEHWRPGGEADFGPYLGGTQARLAVSGLERVLPLRYTGDRLDGGLRDLARLRGVRPEDRDAISARLSAVLRREVEALSHVRDELARWRDRASANTAFELAGRIQQEIEAVEWIVAEQKVTMLTPGSDAEIYGYADGVLVKFQVRAGRLDRWEQRACAPAAAKRFLARTPPEWSEFAARNAELARSLN